MKMIENAPMPTLTVTPDELTSLGEVMSDLARSADAQAARAAAVDDINASSALFALAAVLRTEGSALLASVGTDTYDRCREILAGAQRIVVGHMLHLDQIQSSRQER